MAIKHKGRAAEIAFGQVFRCDEEISHAGISPHQFACIAVVFVDVAVQLQQQDVFLPVGIGGRVVEIDVFMIFLKRVALNENGATADFMPFECFEIGVFLFFTSCLKNQRKLTGKRQTVGIGGLISGKIGLKFASREAIRGNTQCASRLVPTGFRNPSPCCSSVRR